jgi:hypothetical protein
MRVEKFACDNCGWTADGNMVDFVYAAGGYDWMCKTHDLCNVCRNRAVRYGFECPICDRKEIALARMKEKVDRDDTNICENERESG